MKTSPIRILIIGVVAAAAGYIWLDPGHPSADQASRAIGRINPAGSADSSAQIGRSFVGRRSKDAPKIRVWPVTAAEHQHFYVWKNFDGQWEAEKNRLAPPQWENLGFFGFMGL